LEVVVFLCHVGVVPHGHEGVYFFGQVFVFGLLVEIDKKVGTKFRVTDVGEDFERAVEGGSEGLVIADADLQEDEKGETNLGFFVRGGTVAIQQGVDVLLGVAPALGACLNAVIFDGVEEEYLAVGLETKTLSSVPSPVEGEGRPFGLFMRMVVHFLGYATMSHHTEPLGYFFIRGT